MNFEISQALESKNKPRNMNARFILLLAGWAWLAADLEMNQSLGAPQTAAAPQAVDTNSPPPAPQAEPSPPPSAPPKKSVSEIEKLVMPIALHPDPLISILLPAAAYPLEIVQAARFVKDTNNIPKVDDQPWDDNVKAVAKVPELIAKMDADINWTMELGETFVAQPKDVMDTIQELRLKAKKAGTLQTSPQQIVTVTNIVVSQTNITEVVNVTKEVVQVQPANPQVVYVPTYPPTVYYPPPSYVYNPYAPLVTFGVGMAMGAIMANNCNWGYGHVDVDVDRNVNRNVNRNTDRNRTQNTTRANANGARSGSQQWQPNQSRMQQSGSKASGSNRESRGWGSSGGGTPSTGNLGSRPSTGNAGSRPSTGNAGARPSTGNAGQRPSTPSASQRPASSGGSARASTPSYSRPSTSGGGGGGGRSSGSAFSNSSSGSSTRASSSRGSSSRGGGGGGGRGGGGGGRRR
jgi:hypothetical protein